MKKIFLTLSLLLASVAHANTTNVNNVYGDVQSAAIDAASSGDNTIIAAVSGRKICVLGVAVVASAAVTVRFEDGAGGSALTGQMQLGANGGFVLPQAMDCWFETSAGALLNLELSGATSVDGVINYTVID